MCISALKLHISAGMQQRETNCTVKQFIRLFNNDDNVVIVFTMYLFCVTVIVNPCEC